MLSSLKEKISNIIHENLKSKHENYINKVIIKAYKKITLKSSKFQLNYKKLLIDGSFYNLGYFYRLQLLRSLLKNDSLEEYSFICKYNKKINKFILNSLGVKNIKYLDNYRNKEYLLEANDIVKNLKKPEDIINYPFKYGVPGSFIYDVILKKQRSNTVDINDKKIKNYIYEYLLSIYFSKKLLDEIKPDIVALSHGHSLQCGPLAYLASKSEIKTLILYGGYGVPRFIQINKPSDLDHGIPHPSKKDIKNPKILNRDLFKKIGFEYLEKRVLGQFQDLGSRLAYGKDKKVFNLENHKISEKKIIAIYVSNWYDVPHIFGMERFLDIFEWTKETIKAAAKNKDIIWLLKPHPAEKWYGGITLEEALPKKLPSNIILLPNNYSGKSIIEVSDALVTFHGTSGIEFACYGKPVLVADKGWYHNCEFVIYPESREHYLKLLETNWYENLNINEIQDKAQLFAGIYFGNTEWQGKAVLPDDSDRSLIREILPTFVEDNKDIIKKEIEVLNKWLKTKEVDFHTFKMIEAYKDI